MFPGRIVRPNERFALFADKYFRRMPPSLAAAVSHSPPAESAADRLVALLHAVEGCCHALRRAIEQLAARHKLTTSQLTALWACVGVSDGVGQSRLATEIGVSAAQASALVEGLRRRGLLAPRRTPDDRRRQHWSLTAEGRQTVASASVDLAGLARHLDATLDANLGGRQTRSLAEALADIVTSIEASPRSSGDAFPRLHESAATEGIAEGTDATATAPAARQEARR